MQTENLRAKRRKRRRTIGVVFSIVSLLLLIFGNVYTNGISDRWRDSYIDKQKEIAMEALEKGYTCYEAVPTLQYAGTEGGFDILVATTETGERFAILATDDPDRIYADGMHSAVVEVFVNEDSAEIRNIEGFDMPLYTDCYAALDYNGQGEAFGGAVAGLFAKIAVFLIFMILLTTGILLIVFNRKESASQRI